jgi:hypothetical protein
MTMAEMTGAEYAEQRTRKRTQSYVREAGQFDRVDRLLHYASLLGMTSIYLSRLLTAKEPAMLGDLRNFATDFAHEASEVSKIASEPEIEQAEDLAYLLPYQELVNVGAWTEVVNGDQESVDRALQTVRSVLQDDPGFDKTALPQAITTLRIVGAKFRDRAAAKLNQLDDAV